MSPTLDPISHTVGRIEARVETLESKMEKVEGYLPKIDNIEYIVTQMRTDSENERGEHRKTRAAITSRMWAIASGILLFVVQNALQGGILPDKYHGIANLAVGLGAIAVVVFLVARPGHGNES